MRRRTAGTLLVLALGGGAHGTAQLPLRPYILGTPASVRFAGFNGAGAALVGHAGTVFTNPAGLATVRHAALEAAYQTAPFDGYVGMAALGWRLRQFDVGVGLQYYDIGLDGAGLPLSGAFEALGVGSLVYRFGLLAVGASAKYLRQRIDDVDEDGLSGDLGVAVAVFDIMALGFAVQNIGGNWDRRSPLDLPRTTRFGFTMNYVDPLETFRLLSTIEWVWPSGTDTQFILGGEGGMVVGRVGVVGRVAYRSHADETGLSAVTFGATLELAWVDIDAAIEPRAAPESDVKRLGFRFAF